MLFYLDNAWEKRPPERRRTAGDLYEAVVEGAVELRHGGHGHEADRRVPDAPEVILES